MPVVQTRVARALLHLSTVLGRDVGQEVADLTQDVFVTLFADEPRPQASTRRRGPPEGGTTRAPSRAPGFVARGAHASRLGRERRRPAGRKDRQVTLSPSRRGSARSDVPLLRPRQHRHERGDRSATPDARPARPGQEAARPRAIVCSIRASVSPTADALPAAGVRPERQADVVARARPPCGGPRRARSSSGAACAARDRP